MNKSEKKTEILPEIASQQRYTLSLPKDIYDEISEYANKHGVSIKEVVRQYLKFSIVSSRFIDSVNEDFEAEIVLRKKNKDGICEEKILTNVFF